MSPHQQDPADRERIVSAVFAAGWFDADWYRSTYPDVGILDADPAAHYRAYGYAMGRAPNAALDRAPGRLRALHRPPPPPGHELTTAADIASGGDLDLAVDLARLFLPPAQAHCADVLEANRAIARGDEIAWGDALNAYIGAFGGRPFRLGSGRTIFERLQAPAAGAVADGPLISVIMPAWNAAATLRKAAVSILEQTWRNLELLIVDDASDDETWRIINDLAAADRRVKPLRSCSNVGPYVCKNLAIDHARGDWITGHDADDWAHPCRLEDQCGAAIAAAAAAGVGYMLRITPQGRASKISMPSEFSPDGVAKISSVSALFRADVLKARIGYFDSVRFGADTEMLARTRRIVGADFQYVRSINMICLDGETSLTNDPVHGIRAQDGGPSATRANYMSTWQAWLAARSGSDGLYLPFPQSVRRYQGDFNHQVDQDRIVDLHGPDSEASAPRN